MAVLVVALGPGSGLNADLLEEASQQSAHIQARAGASPLRNPRNDVWIRGAASQPAQGASRSEAAAHSAGWCSVCLHRDAPRRLYAFPSWGRPLAPHV